jgi:A/G-specific adenine glycosylase
MEFEKLLTWYQENKRDLVFRKTREPYHIWISEIMLQQTQVDTVLPYFVRFLKQYPTVLDLANAREEALLKVVEGLGYYRRFKNMLKAAKHIAIDYNGNFPNTYEEIIKLPGIGVYTAGAIMSICYDAPYSAVDGNVIRVLSRYFMLDQNMRIEKNKKMVNHINQQLIEKTDPNTYTQALMELGALVCRPLNPKCDVCPLNQKCLAHINQKEHVYPMLSKLKEKPTKHWITFMIETPNGLILRKRDEALLNGMYEYPQIEAESLNYALEMLEDEGVYIEIISDKTSYKHVFTHMIWEMDVYQARLISGMKSTWSIVSKNEFITKPMAVAHRKIKK